jgi:hypothetical protein
MIEHFYKSIFLFFNKKQELVLFYIFEKSVLLFVKKKCVDMISLLISGTEET